MYLLIIAARAEAQDLIRVGRFPQNSASFAEERQGKIGCKNGKPCRTTITLTLPRSLFRLYLRRHRRRRRSRDAVCFATPAIPVVCMSVFSFYLLSVFFLQECANTLFSAKTRLLGGGSYRIPNGRNRDSSLCAHPPLDGPACNKTRLSAFPVKVTPSDHNPPPPPPPPPLPLTPSPPLFCLWCMSPGLSTLTVSPPRLCDMASWGASRTMPDPARRIMDSDEGATTFTW